MPIYERRNLEVDRVSNLLTGFKWREVSRKTDREKLSVDFKLDTGGQTQAEARMSVDSAQNLVGVFGWTVDSIELTEDTARMSFQKVLKPEIPLAPA